MCGNVVDIQSATAENSRGKKELECGPMPNVMAPLPPYLTSASALLGEAGNPEIGGALCSTPQSLADAHYSSAVQ